MKSLQVLELQGLTKLTDTGVMQLCSLVNLYKVDLSGCTGLSAFIVNELSKKIEEVIWSEDLFDPSLCDSFAKQKKKSGIFRVQKARLTKSDTHALTMSISHNASNNYIIPNLNNNNNNNSNKEKKKISFHIRKPKSKDKD